MYSRIKKLLFVLENAWWLSKLIINNKVCQSKLRSLFFFLMSDIVRISYPSYIIYDL